MRKVTVYTDGSSLRNPGPGGWGAVVILESGEHKVLSEASEHDKITNNIMELMGPISVLERLPCACDVTLYSDSQYVIKGMTEWRQGWTERKWVGVKNVELWKRLIRAAERHNVTWKWVRGHNGDHFNEMADKAAYTAAKAKWGCL